METINAIVAKLDEMYPGKNLLNIKDISEYTGLSRPAVKKMFGLARGIYLDKIVVATTLADKARMPKA